MLGEAAKRTMLVAALFGASAMVAGTAEANGTDPNSSSAMSESSAGGPPGPSAGVVLDPGSACRPQC